MVDLINANADAFSYARVIRPPIVEGLEFWNYYGGDSDMRRNLVPGKPAGIPAGDPTVGDFYIQCEGMTHYVQTAVPASNEFTLIAVAKEVVPAHLQHRFGRAGERRIHPRRVDLPQRCDHGERPHAPDCPAGGE